MFRFAIVASILALGTGCFGAKCGEGTVKVKGECLPIEDAPTDTDGTTSTSATAPEILQFSANAEDLTEGEVLVFTAVVRDEQGIEDVIGGTLETPNGRVYGAFQTSGDEGAYQLTVSWATIEDTKEITFEDGEERRFVAHFFDQKGDSTTKETTVQLYCEDAQEQACSGSCTNLRDDKDNCGECGRQCVDVFDSGTCSGTVCRGYTSCGKQSTVSANTTCGDVCDGLGAVCDRAGYHSVFDGDTCSVEVANWSSCTAKINDYLTNYAAESFRCKCYQE